MDNFNDYTSTTAYQKNRHESGPEEEAGPGSRVGQGPGQGQGQVPGPGLGTLETQPGAYPYNQGHINVHPGAGYNYASLTRNRNISHQPPPPHYPDLLMDPEIEGQCKGQGQGHGQELPEEDWQQRRRPDHIHQEAPEDWRSQYANGNSHPGIHYVTEGHHIKSPPYHHHHHPHFHQFPPYQPEITDSPSAYSHSGTQGHKFNFDPGHVTQGQGQGQGHRTSIPNGGINIINNLTYQHEDIKENGNDLIGHPHPHPQYPNPANLTLNLTNGGCHNNNLYDRGQDNPLLLNYSTVGRDTNRDLVVRQLQEKFGVVRVSSGHPQNLRSLDLQNDPANDHPAFPGYNHVQLLNGLKPHQGNNHVVKGPQMTEIGVGGQLQGHGQGHGQGQSESASYGDDEEDQEETPCFLLDSLQWPCLGQTESAGAPTNLNTNTANGQPAAGGGKICGDVPGKTPENSNPHSHHRSLDGLYWKSVWIHCRLPLLLLLVFALLVIFLFFSGILIYFKYVPYRAHGLGANDEPCEETSCAFGSSCRVEGGRASCHCPETCPQNYAPICGSDDVTYSNECLLRLFACQNQKSIRIRHSGECGVPDPCASKKCQMGSRCVPTMDGRYATCECPANCSPGHGSDHESYQLAVCGSDGKLYRNRCELDREACRWSRNITLKYFGKCDPCEDILCTAPQVCHLDEERRPICRCGEVCSMDFDPVCASDGKTYSNECLMRQEGCRSRRDLRIIYRGKCSSGVNPCEARTCRGYETCAINRHGIAQCTCAMNCEPVISPVCGSDNRTYENPCELSFVSCHESRHVAVAYRGTCEAANACARHSCPPEATCLEKNGETVCECPVCPSDYEPVCGSDGVSYQNECRLKMEACLTNTNIHKIYAGLCNLIRDFNRDDGCERMQCDFYSVCTASGEGARCVCPNNCSTEVSERSKGAVCGTDGVTYKSECELQKSACRQQKFVVVATQGVCDLCAHVECKFGATCENGKCGCPTHCPPTVTHTRDTVCGSDGVTYDNECELQKRACEEGLTSLTLHFYGHCRNVTAARKDLGLWITTETTNPEGVHPTPQIATPDFDQHCKSIRCDFGAVCELAGDGLPRCTCQFSCHQERLQPVCGSNLKLYPNDCEMRREACHRQIELRPRPLELCEDGPVGEKDKDKDKMTTVNMQLSKNGVNGPRGTTPMTPVVPQHCPDNVGSNDCIPSSSSNGSSSTSAASICQCNKLGSIRETCDLVTQECECRHGVGGPKCDRCLPGFYGLTRPNGETHNGCKECGCSRFGSVREDCEQMTGRCVCKSGVLGHKCDSCEEGEFLGPYGCTPTPDLWNLGRSCADIVCEFGADCEEDGRRGACICNIQCTEPSDGEVCASDGFTYESECQVRRTACHSQKAISVLHVGVCPTSTESEGTESPLPRWTGLHFTEPGDDGAEVNPNPNPISGSGLGLGPDDLASRSGGYNGGNSWTMEGHGGGAGYSTSSSASSLSTSSSSGSSGMKSTRHLPPQSKYQEMSPFHRSFYTHRAPTLATVQMRSYLGDSCQWTADCITAHSICLSGFCACRENFYEDRERLQCKPIHAHLSGVLSCGGSSSGPNHSKSNPNPSVNPNPNSSCDPPSTCFDHRNGSFVCVCPMGRTSPRERCSRNDKLYPFFNGRSTISLDKLAGYHKLSLELEITPFLNYQHGILIFSSQHGNGSGDFLSLALIDGYVEFRYDLGDGPAVLRSTSRVTSGSTHRIVAKRYNRDGLLRLDEEEDVKGTSPGSMKSLNLDHGGYIGHVPLNSTKIWETAGTSEGFIGCIHKLRIGRRPIEFDEKRDPLIRSISQVAQCPRSTPDSGLTTLTSHLGHLGQFHHHRFGGPLTTPMYTPYEGENPEEDREREREREHGHENRVGDEMEQEEEQNRRVPMSNEGVTPGQSGLNMEGEKELESNRIPHTGITSPGLTDKNDKEVKNRSSPNKKNPCLPKGKGAPPCHNNGQCWSDKGRVEGYRCVCHPEFTGKNCESKTTKMEETGAMLDFRGFSYLELPKIENAARHVSLELWLMLRSPNGLILYNGQEPGKGDFVTLLVSQGHIQFLFDLGSGMANLTWSHPVTLNKWHWIVASRDGREASLQVNGHLPQTTKSPPTLSELNLELPLYVGGIGDLNTIHRELGLLNSFDGVLQFLRVNGETFHREIGHALRQRLVHRYEGPPCGTSVSPPCQNEGTCFPRLSSHVCLCPRQFSGVSCEIKKEAPGPIRFDGTNFLKFPQKIAKHESFNSSDYEDFYGESFDSQLDDLFFESSGPKLSNVGGPMTDDLGEVNVNANVNEDDQEEEDYYFNREENPEYEEEDYDFDEHVQDFEEFRNFAGQDLDIVQRSKAQRRNRIEIVFRTTSESPGLVLWTGRNSWVTSGSKGKAKSRRGYLGLFVVDGHAELRIDLGAGRNKKPTVIRSKVTVSDGRWHQLLIARQRRLIVLQVDGSIPQRATAEIGSNVLVSDGRYWIGGVMPSILPADIPAPLHQGFIGCVDLVRVEKRRLPLSKIAHSVGVPPCDEDDD